MGLMAFFPQVVSSETELTEEKNWQVMCSAEDSSGKVSLTTDECQIHLQHFSLFACLQTPPEGSSGKKWLQVVHHSIQAQNDNINMSG